MVTTEESRKLTVRKLTERECLRLMSYTDEEIDRLMDAKDEKGKQLFSRSYLYQMAGNSVVVDCFAHILTEVIKDMEAPKEKRKTGQYTLFDF